MSAFGLAAALGIAKEAARRGPETIPGALAFVVFVLGPALLAAGILTIAAGIRNLKHRGRTLGLIAVASAGVALPTCYCAPTALGLLVYGLVVYLNGEVRAAFAETERDA